MKGLLSEILWLCLFTPYQPYPLFVNCQTMLSMPGMLTMPVLVEKFHICVWWDQISSLGPPFGYFPNASKAWLAVKEQYLTHAQMLFANTCVNITADGRPYLGAAIGSTNYITQYVSCKISTWVHDLQLLSSFAVTQPHAAYSAFTHGLISKWLFIARTIPNVDDLFQPLLRSALDTRSFRQ